MRGIVRFLCFSAFGICTFYSPIDQTNMYRIIFGIWFGIFFGWLFKKFLIAMLSLFNMKYKKENGKKPIKDSAKNGMMFLLPFAVMLLIATFGLKWAQTAAFVSTGIMAVGTAAAIEIGKVTGKPSIKNTIATSGVCFLFSFIWTLSTPFLITIPGKIEGLMNIGMTFIKKGGV